MEIAGVKIFLQGVNHACGNSRLLYLIHALKKPFALLIAKIQDLARYLIVILGRGMQRVALEQSVPDGCETDVIQVLLSLWRSTLQCLDRQVSIMGEVGRVTAVLGKINQLFVPRRRFIALNARVT